MKKLTIFVGIVLLGLQLHSQDTIKNTMYKNIIINNYLKSLNKPTYTSVPFRFNNKQIPRPVHIVRLPSSIQVGLRFSNLSLKFGIVKFSNGRALVDESTFRCQMGYRITVP